MNRAAHLRSFLLTVVLTSIASLLFADDTAPVKPAKINTQNNYARFVLNLPKLERPPTLEDFSGMEPGNDLAKKMAKAEQFVQQQPNDGKPASQRTEAYLGYDDKNVYVIFLCFDDPGKVRAHMTRRENALDDDYVEITFDTFKDKRRGFLFASNPLGIQHDAMWSESGGTDYSFDTLWENEGKLNDKGWMVRFAIPFRSLSFRREEMQDWGVALQRVIQRETEQVFWPWVSSNVTGRLNQAGTAKGMENVSPGRNMQFIPYFVSRTYRQVDDVRNPNAIFFGETAARAGLDSKIVIKDAFVLDTTVKPDFSQVESDEPQITVNQRFEVFFPEKRPFFLENASYFDTPITLDFTRRIANPDYGVRLTGKTGPYAVGVLFADDAAPGYEVQHGDPNDGKKAFFGLFRVNRDLGKQNTLGLIYTSRDFAGTFNRVGGVDGSFRWKKNWSAQFQFLESSTQHSDGTYGAGPATFTYLAYASRKFNYNVLYKDNAAGFETQTGFFQRPDIRRLSHFINYRWFTSGKHPLLNFGPNFFWVHLFDHAGTRLDYDYNPQFVFNFKRNSDIGIGGDSARTKLRPQDFTSLTTNRDYSNNDGYLFFDSDLFKQLSIHTFNAWGRNVNFNPLTGFAPTPAKSNQAQYTVTVKPIDKLKIDNTYLLFRLRNENNSGVLNSHTIRSKWNYQFNRELSIRVIGQYNALLTNANSSSLQTRKNLNADFLITYLVHPGTAVYVGYNSNLSNLDPRLIETSTDGLLARRNQFINDGRQFFVKISYLFRY